MSGTKPFKRKHLFDELGEGPPLKEMKFKDIVKTAGNKYQNRWVDENTTFTKGELHEATEKGVSEGEVIGMPHVLTRQMEIQGQKLIAHDIFLGDKHGVKFGVNRPGLMNHVGGSGIPVRPALPAA